MIINSPNVSSATEALHHHHKQQQPNTCKQQPNELLNQQVVKVEDSNCDNACNSTTIIANKK